MKHNPWKFASLVLIVALACFVLASCSSGYTEEDIQASYNAGYASGYEDGNEVGYENARSEFLPRLEHLCFSIGDPETLVVDFHNGEVSIYEIADFLEFMKEELWDMVC